MIEILRDPVWQFVGAALAAVAIFVAIRLSQRERNLKRLAFFTRSTELLSIKDELRDRVKILYNDKPVEDVRLCEFGIRNVGSVPIVPTDFIRPIEFFLGDKSRVLTADISSTSPPDLGAQIQWANGQRSTEAATTVVIAPLLLNQGDVVSVKGLVTGSKQIDVRGRIVGVKEIEPEAQPRRKAIIFLFLLGILIGVLASAASAWLYKWSTSLSGLLMSLGLGSIVVAIVVGVKRLTSRLTRTG